MAVELDRTAIVVGYDGLGAVGILAQLFGYYGFSRTIALVDDPAKYPQDLEGVIYRQIENILDPDALAGAVRAECGSRQLPFLCVQDYAMLSYLDALDRLYGSQKRRFFVPAAGIRRARVKPHARKLLNEAGLGAAKWTLLTGDAKRDAQWRKVGGLDADVSGPFFVKPCFGTASVLVTPAATWQEAVAAADQIRQHLRSVFAQRMQPLIKIDGVVYDLLTDILVEQRLAGAEFCLDGLSHEGSAVSLAVQHKETVRGGVFAGDGGIYSPPDYALHTLEPMPPLQFSGAATTSIEELERFATKALAALELHNWAFHCEVKAAGETVEMIELNPRAPGGLLWMTAGLQLGLDPIEHMVRSHLRIPSVPTRRNWVTAQFPIYAERLGRIAAIDGVEAARAIEHVHRIVPAKKTGDVVSLDRLENYAAYVCIHAPNHAAARGAEEAVRRILKVRYEDE